MTDGVSGRIVVIGGGIIGASIAFHIVRAGHPEVRLLETGRLGAGTTAAATGGIRRQFTNRLNIELSVRSLPFWTEFEAHTGSPLSFRQHGYMFALSDAGDLATFRNALTLQRELGVEVELLEPDRVADLVPGIRTDDLLGATYTPQDGSASPPDALAGLVSASRASGLVVEEGVRFLGLERDRYGAVKGVVTSRGRRECDAVVIAAGPQSRQVGARCGVDIPISPHPRQAFLIATNERVRSEMPLTVDMSTGAYLHPLPTAGSAIVGGSDMDIPPATRARVDWERSQSLLEALRHRFPGVGEFRLERGWSGLREMSPDGNALIGPVKEVPGLWVAAGFSGHGFMQAPAAGDLVARWILSGDPAIDTTGLAPDRFRTDEALESENAAF